MKILSFQSHVASGSVGNSAAVFALQRLGLQVIAVHTTLLSNHPGHGHFGGGPVDAAPVLDGLARSGIADDADAVVSGYLGSPGNARALMRFLAERPSLTYVCDPVMGDHGRLYVNPALPEIFKTQALPRARLITPNLFELSLLTGGEVKSPDQAHRAALQLLKQGPQLAAVTSLDFGDHTGCMLVAADGRAWRVRTPRLDFPQPVNGAGDVLAALLTLEMAAGSAPPQMLENAVSRLYAVLSLTLKSASRELDLVAAQEVLHSPPQSFRAEG